MFRVDFNELIEPDLVLLSKGDVATGVDERSITLTEGLAVSIYMDDFDETGRRDDLIASGHVERNASGQFAHVKWCCRIDRQGIKHSSERV